MRLLVLFAEYLLHTPGKLLQRLRRGRPGAHPALPSLNTSYTPQEDFEELAEELDVVASSISIEINK